MRYKSLVLASILLAATAYAKELKAYQDGKLLQMDSVQCGTDENAKRGKTHELLCQEYLVETDQVVYRVRPKDDKHPVLLPIGQYAQFRLEQNKMVLRVEALDNKERDYVVVSIKPRGDSTAADATPTHVNHLQ
ncbi:MAG TPA: hypothetical protein VGZ91_09790 [Candidatus Sulfotelmatobacter sp.]|jgi:hypothetical protein|nr:hypothetical protein [Candidatus Sulfotelmatobacter sp.]